ncbi:MAG: peptidylprolyl isomerase [Clostridiales bacterium]|nr:peptidylprolyl isomerase [Clostridiales bacterium]
MRKRMAREAEAKQQQKKGGSGLLYIISLATLVLFVLLAIVQYSGMLTRGLTAIKVGNTGYTVSNANFFYRNAYAAFYNSNAEDIDYYMDSSKPLTAQAYVFDPSMTWAEHLWEEAIRQMQRVTAMNDAAAKEGIKLSAEDNEEIDDWIDSMRISAKASGNTLGRYLSAYFGDGNTEKTVRSMLQKSIIADRYTEGILASLSYTDEELEQYYQDNRESLDLVTFLYAFVDAAAAIDQVQEEGDPDDDPEAAAAAAMEYALNAARQICDSSYNREDFQTWVSLLTGGTANSSSTPVGSLDPTLASWLTDSARKEGDTTYIEFSTGYYVLYFVESSDNHYNTVSVRHILTMVQDTDGDGVFSEEEIAAAYDAIQAIYEEWQDAGGTEEAFAELAAIRSEDYGSTGNGGLYENIYKNQMVESFNEFCFGEHAYGDTAIVFNDGYYTGYHLIYYVGQGEPFWKSLVENNRLAEGLSERIEEMVSGYDVQEKFMLRYATDR